MTRLLRILFLVSWVLWLCEEPYQGVVPSWNPLMSFTAFHECRVAALRQATAYARAPKHAIDVQRGAQETDLGARAWISWKSRDIRDGWEPIYECWHADVNVNAIKRAR